MRVAHFLQRYPPALGGSEAYFARLSKFLTQQGHHVTVFTTTAIDLEAFWGPTGRRLRPGTRSQDGVLVRRFPVRNLPIFQPYFFKVLSLLPLGHPWTRLTLPFNPITPEMWWTARYCRENFDLVHAACFPYSGVLECARQLARRLQVPFVLTPFVHTGNPDDPADRTRNAYIRPAFIDLARSAERIFVQTEGERNTLLQTGLSAEKLVMQGMGLDKSCLGGNRDRARQNWGVKSGEVVVGHLANNSPEKGTIDLLRAFQTVWKEERNIRLVLAGPEVPAFRSFRERYQPTGPMVRLGPLTEEEKKDFFAGIDVFALPSRSDSFGLVLPEAWACGVPCIVYRAGGLPWVVRHEQDGLVVPCGDLRGLAEGVLLLARNAEFRHQLGMAGKERTTQGEFDWDRKLNIVSETYQSLV